MPAKLKNGVIGASGGKREGAGRKPDEFKAWIGGIVHNRAVRARFKRVLTSIKTEDNTFIRALELAWHYDQGKPVTRLELPAGSGAGRLIFVFPEDGK